MDKKNCMFQQVISRNQTNRYSANTKIRFCFLKYIYIFMKYREILNVNVEKRKLPAVKFENEAKVVWKQRLRG